MTGIAREPLLQTDVGPYAIRCHIEASAEGVESLTDIHVSRLDVIGCPLDRREDPDVITFNEEDWRPRPLLPASHVTTLTLRAGEPRAPISRIHRSR